MLLKALVQCSSLSIVTESSRVSECLMCPPLPALRVVQSMFEHTGSSDGLGLDDDDDDKHDIPSIKAPLEFIRHPQVPPSTMAQACSTYHHHVRYSPSRLFM